MTFRAGAGKKRPEPEGKNACDFLKTRAFGADRPEPENRHGATLARRLPPAVGFRRMKKGGGRKMNSRTLRKNTAYLSLGSNMDDRLDYLRRALAKLRDAGKIRLTKISSVYETDPVGYTEQGKFLNLAVKLETEWSPFDLLDICQRIEQQLGRKRIIRWGPRTVDLDILLYNREQIDSERLTIPHPRMLERAFVLVPLAEIDPDLVIPGTGKTVKTHLQSISDEGVILWKKNIGEEGSGPFGN
ncbi:2-amino-4-hydroxy-6-hydroxymethyldihydropteridine pyrophosphokinase [Caldibacillus debilis]|uniref:2-amino-4-hydroxy-6-hydroxymethyldihydropteridine diphosphokinase n=2 Tax=Caldibacillus debilis TaxID=301148 RepID=A0A150LCV5_9BACI|nr:2-amino-4-hydroxy-6-hydroxymethyldihydropteridine pyrophosphokinase [Caldibacillus debilis]